MLNQTDSCGIGVLFPGDDRVSREIQRKAQAEIDQVIGAGRLPGFQDRRNLPYIDAVVKELLR